MKKLLFLGLGLVASGSASAALLGYEGMDYANGTTFVGQSGGIGFTSIWSDLDGTQANPLVTNGVATWASQDTIVRAFTAQTSGEVWLKYTGVLSSASYVNFTDSNTFATAGASIAYNSGGGGGQFLRAYAASTDVESANAGTSEGLAPVSTVGVSNTIYVRLVLGAGATSTAWLNPGAGFDGTQTGTTFTTNVTVVDRIKVNMNFVAGDEGTIDQLIVGTTVADVIPEPSAALLGGLSALALLRRRRA